jgi:DNA-binding NarL/FixJ family response regulator
VERFRARYPELAAFTGVFALDQVRLAVASAQWDVALQALDDVAPALAGEAERLRGDIHRARGDDTAAAAAYARATGAAAGTALVELRAGRRAAAAARIRRALATATDACDRAVLLPAAVEILATDDPEEAAILAAELVDIATVLTSPLLNARGCLASAEAALARGDLDLARIAITEALAGFDSLRVPVELARAHTVAAAVCAARNEPEAAAIERRAAAELAERFGFAHPGDPAEEPPVPVSARELDVLRQLAAGNTNRQIADALTLSPRTVDRHVSNIFTKLGVTTRAAAAAYAVEQGLA